MIPKSATLTSWFFIAGGLALAAAGMTSMIRPGNPLPSNQNPMALQGSAYGKLLARLSETTIDRVWHLGVEEIVPHYMTGIAHGESESDHHDDREAHSSPKPGASSASIAKAAESSNPIRTGKKWIQARVIAQHHRTNPNSLSESHKATVYHDVERMLLRSFKLDPTHYGAYDSYHLFLTTQDFGGSPEAKEQATKVANAAIGAAFQENEDPEPWLTAAAAGMNLYLLEAGPHMQRGESIPLELLREYQQKIGYCLSRFDELQKSSEEAGNWDNLSTERQMEISERSLFAKRTFKQFDALIARAEAKLQPSEPGESVAKSEEKEP
ncbi:MAG: hypothetical protein KDN18_20720 [Verrucomicrobiae bacterium]|nr:hypothetical protein [Verrucomicrobiae bacterium]